MFLLLYSTSNVPVILVSYVYSIMDMVLVLNPVCSTAAVPLIQASLCMYDHQCASHAGPAVYRVAGK